MKAVYLFIFTLAVGGAWYFTQNRSYGPSSTTAAASGEFQCAGKIYCSQMTSCQEALFYLRNCPGTQMDGDGDKVPCEKEWCGHSISQQNNF